MKEKINHWTLPFGVAVLEKTAVTFSVWAPFAEEVEVKIAGHKRARLIPMKRGERGCFEAVVENLPVGTRYFYRLNGKAERPDPYSRFQPEGVHGPSEVVDPYSFEWSASGWNGIPIEDYITYELHPGTFAPEGTFESIIPRLGYLKNELGVTAIELMPVAQFPGKRNWGYDGVHLFAPQLSYGGPAGLKRLVDACHQAGLAARCAVE